MILVKIRLIAAVYRQWKARGESGANTSLCIARQCQRLKVMTEKLNKIFEDNFELVVAGDMNIDQHIRNNPCNRPDIKALTPILEELMMTKNIIQMNHKPTRHQVGCKSSLLDLFRTNIPDRMTNIENFVNTLSEYEGVKCTLQTKSQVKIPKSRVIRNYSKCTFNIMQPLVDANPNLQSIFQDTNPDIISDKIVTGLKEITDIVVKNKIVQVTQRGFQFWTGELEIERKEVESLNRKAIEARDIDDIRANKHRKNKHIKT